MGNSNNEHRKTAALTWANLLRCSVFVFSFLLLSAFTAGCGNTTPAVPTTQSIRLAATSGLQPPVTDEKLKAIVVPPIGWKPEPVKFSDKHRHQIWISPSGNTAYGVIYFSLPFPIGNNLAMDGFLRQMKNTEGTADLLSREEDDKLGGIRFVADGAFYEVHGNLTAAGFHAWVVYAATVRAKAVNVVELKTAERAREQTHVNVP